jgi:1-acyl-sn-glycerol-3-phosphate acyltransferase
MMNNPVGRHILVDPATARPAPYRGALSEIIRWGCMAYLALAGWKMRGDWPKLDKFVLVAAPHTSNWDGINMLAAAAYYRVPLRWMGKKSLTTGPFGWLVRALGCIPIDRSRANDIVRIVADEMIASKTMVLAVPPEGTRSLARAWKTGFYHIARLAGAPIVVAILDYGTRTISIRAILYPGDDAEEDIALIRSHYREARGLRDDKFSAEG